MTASVAVTARDHPVLDVAFAADLHPAGVHPSLRAGGVRGLM
jgi:hypothetical protein